MSLYTLLGLLSEPSHCNQLSKTENWIVVHHPPSRILKSRLTPMMQTVNWKACSLSGDVCMWDFCFDLHSVSPHTMTRFKIQEMLHKTFGVQVFFKNLIWQWWRYTPISQYIGLKWVQTPPRNKAENSRLPDFLILTFPILCYLSHSTP